MARFAGAGLVDSAMSVCGGWSEWRDGDVGLLVRELDDRRDG